MKKIKAIEAGNVSGTLARHWQQYFTRRKLQIFQLKSIKL